MKISIIAAIASENGALGKGNKLIYAIPEDLKRFKKITSGHPIIMGRKTFESIGRILPHRTNIIISRDSGYKVEGAIVINSLDEAIKVAKEKEIFTFHERQRNEKEDQRVSEPEIFIIGGGQIFAASINLADKLYLTIIEDNPEADVFFPDYSEFKKVVFEENHEYQGLRYKFLDLEKP